jgi:hypothetical protein
MAVVTGQPGDGIQVNRASVLHPTDNTVYRGGDVVTGESEASTAEPTTPTTLAEPTTSEEPDELDIILSEEETPAPLEGGDFEAFNEQFKKYMGIDLKDATAKFETLVAQYEAVVANQNAQSAQVALAHLTQTWGVSPEEVDRRVEQVLKVADKLSPAERAKYDSAEGVAQLWDRIEASRSRGKTPSSRGGDTTSASAEVFKASEVYQLMRNDPKAYNAIVPQLEVAIREGRYIDDTRTRR